MTIPSCPVDCVTHWGTNPFLHPNNPLCNIWARCPMPPPLPSPTPQVHRTSFFAWVAICYHVHHLPNCMFTYRICKVFTWVGHCHPFFFISQRRFRDWMMTMGVWGMEWVGGDGCAMPKKFTPHHLRGTLWLTDNGVTYKCYVANNQVCWTAISSGAVDCVLMGTQPSLMPALSPWFFMKILLGSIYQHAHIHMVQTPWVVRFKFRVQQSKRSIKDDKGMKCDWLWRHKHRDSEVHAPQFILHRVCHCDYGPVALSRPLCYMAQPSPNGPYH